MRSPSLKEVDIVELVEFHGELEGGLQVAHGLCEEQARARAARRAMPRPLPARSAHAAARPGLTAWARTHCTDHTRTLALHAPGAARCGLGNCRAGPRVRQTRAEPTQPLTPTYGSQCGNQEFIF